MVENIIIPTAIIIIVFSKMALNEELSSSGNLCKYQLITIFKKTSTTKNQVDEITFIFYD